MNNKQQIGGIVTNPSIGLIKNRPPTRGEENPVKLPDMHDIASINAQREAMRQEEMNRGRQQGN
jgi:hypothetical protein